MKLTQRAVEAVKPAADRDVFVWDTELRGFGVRVKPSGAAAYVVQYRVNGGGQTRRKVVGKVGTLTASQAREMARKDLAAVANGADPSRERREARVALTVAQLCDQYLTAARAGLVVTRFGRPKRASTVAIDEGRVSRHIVPLLGRELAAKVTRRHVQKMYDAIAIGATAGKFKTKARGKAVVTGGVGAATRVVELIGGIWTWAQKRGLVPDGVNPAHNVDRARGQPKDRVLSPAELVALGKILRRDAAAEPAAVAVVRLIALTGLRRAEAVKLKWGEVDLAASCIRLQTSKTGRSTRPIGKLAVEHLSALAPEALDPEAWLFPSAAKPGQPADLAKKIARLFDAAGLADARCHDLRRTFASFAANEGLGDAAVAELLGHARRSVTERHYVRRADLVMISMASTVAARIVACLDREDDGAAVIDFAGRGAARGEAG